MRSKKSRLLLFFVFVLILGLLLTACGGEEPTPTPEPPPPTNTPAPTNTPMPTNTPEPTATPDVTAGFVTLENLQQGFRIQHPGNWFTADDSGLFGFTTIASNEELLDSPDPGEEGGATIVLVGDSSDFGGDPIEGLNIIVDDFDIADDAEFAEEPAPTTINGKDAATAVIKGTSDNDIPIVAYIVVIIDEDRALLFMGATPAETETDFMPIFQAMASTIELFEPEVSAPEAEGFLLYGETVTGSVTEVGPATWSFIGIEGEVIDIIVQPLDGFDVVVDLLDESGSSVLENGEQDASFGTEEILNFTIPSTGDFFIIIRGFDNTTGNYDLTLNEAGGTGVNFASEGVIAYGDTINGTVTESGPSVWNFDGSAGDVIDIIVTPLDESFDVVVDVIDSSGASILENGEVDNSFDAEQIIGQVLPGSGKYSISIRGFADATGNYELTLNSGGSSGDLGDLEGTIEYGQLVSGRLETDVPHAWAFRGSEGDYVDVTAAPVPEELDIVVDVVDFTGFSILPDGPFDKYFRTEYLRTIRLPENGEYAIVISGFDGGVGEYEVSLELSPATFPGSAVFASDIIEEALEEHFFYFSAFAGEVVTAILEPEGGFDVVVEVYSDDTKELLDELDSSVSFEEMTFLVPEDGNYYFLVKGFEGGTGSYDITLLGPDDVLFTLAAFDGVAGRLGDNGFIEYWYDIMADETITLFAESSDDIDLVIQILDLDDTVLAEVDNTVSGESEELTYTSSEEVVLIIRISDFFEGSGEFFLSVE